MAPATAAVAAAAALSEGEEPSPAVVNEVHPWTRLANSGKDRRFLGLRQKTDLMMSLSSSDMGRMVCKKSLLRTKAEKVSSRGQACFHGLRPKTRLMRITPRDQTSLAALSNDVTRSTYPPWHSIG